MKRPPPVGHIQLPAAGEQSERHSAAAARAVVALSARRSPARRAQRARQQRARQAAAQESAEYQAAPEYRQLHDTGIVMDMNFKYCQDQKVTVIFLTKQNN